MSDLNGRPTDYKSVALPTELKWHFGDPDGNRTHVSAVKGRCLNRLTKEPCSLFAPWGRYLRRDNLNIRYAITFFPIWQEGIFYFYLQIFCPESRILSRKNPLCSPPLRACFPEHSLLCRFLSVLPAGSISLCLPDHSFMPDRHQRQEPQKIKREQTNSHMLRNLSLIHIPSPRD